MLVKKNKVFCIKANRKIQKNMDSDNDVHQLNSIQIDDNDHTQTISEYADDAIVTSPINNDLLPKNIFLIWFGDKLPKYANRVVQEYRKINPDFNVQFIHKTLNEILYAKNDEILLRCKEYIKLTTLKTDNKYFKRIKAEIDQEFNYIQILSDIYRFELLWEYGGIYVDCDTWPLAKFDDSYLQKNGFNTLVFGNLQINTSKWKDIHDHKNVNKQRHAIFDQNSCFSKYNDIYCFGLPRHYTDEQLMISDGMVFLNTTKLIWYKNIEFDEQFIEIRDQFLSEKYDNIYKLQSLVFISNIMHFRESTWTRDWKTNPMRCMYDSELYQDDSQNTIQKNLIFIWIGDTIPNYVNVCIDSYSKMNPSFDIIFKHFTIHDIIHPIDPCLKIAVNYVLEVKDGIRNAYYDFIKNQLDENQPFCKIVSSILRYVIAKDCGGIFVDVNTLPLRPFDDRLMACGSFNAISIEHVNEDANDFIVNNAAFMFGLCKADDTEICVYENSIGVKNNFNTGIYSKKFYDNNIDFQNARIKFFNGQLNSISNFEDDNKYVICFYDDPNYVYQTCIYDYQENASELKYLDKRRIEYVDGIIQYVDGMVEIIPSPTIEQLNSYGTLHYSEEQTQNAKTMQYKIHNAIQKIWKGIEQ